jgi:hypothetical protein
VAADWKRFYGELLRELYTATGISGSHLLSMSKATIINFKKKVKGKGHPRKGHEGPGEE